MTAGPSATNVNAFIDSITGAAGGGFIQYHTGDPGAAGTANTADTTRPAIAFPAASAGSSTQTGTSTLSGWAGGSVTVTHGSLWSASSGGTFRGSFAFTASRAVVNGDNLLTSGVVCSSAPVAA